MMPHATAPIQLGELEIQGRNEEQVKMKHNGQLYTVKDCTFALPEMPVEVRVRVRRTCRMHSILLTCLITAMWTQTRSCILTSLFRMKLNKRISGKPILTRVRATSHKNPNSLDGRALLLEVARARKMAPRSVRQVKELVDETSDIILQISSGKIELVHATSVMEWIHQESEAVQRQSRTTEHCENCWNHTRDRPPYQAGPKHGHLLLARHNMRTLNSEGFQKEHIFRPWIADDELRGAKDGEAWGNGGDPCAGGEAGKDISITGEPHDDPDGGSSPPAVDAGESSYESEQNHDSESDGRSSAEDFDSDAATVTTFDASESADEDSQFPGHETKSEIHRCELTNRHYRIRQAELEWPEVERAKGPYAKSWSEFKL
ncbi:hypothetical protein MPH_13319 [Macrophomina phaseolina MS6]|uniref:Uncharacterized protein n=1 Tax=Macrophomina phaseolina (strain MS6) TaxID=1126212 RepID=K2QIJ7_MACPH|nr:hypothetical protein MPH_13319 [Macrophomina phaseolina MS6]